MAYCVLQIALLLLVCVTALPTTKLTANVLIVYDDDVFDQNKAVAQEILQGAESAACNVRLVAVSEANYKRDVYEFADAVIIGSGVYNGNAHPSILSFINSFDFMDDMSNKVGASFSTGGGVTGGLQPVLEQLNRGLQTFRFIIAGGASWQNGEGTGVLTSPAANWTMSNDVAKLAHDQGQRVGRLVTSLKQTTCPDCPPKKNQTTDSPPAWGGTWNARVSANLTQVGYDAGLVIVNFTAQCGQDPSRQKMRTVYGDFYTVLTRCDLGKEFTIAPASRGGACTSREIGKDVDKRICKACGCPFCVRDTNGTFSHGEEASSTTVWKNKELRTIQGVQVMVYTGRAESKSSTTSFDLETTIAYDAHTLMPRFVNVSHPLWVQTSARIDGFSNAINQTDLEIPAACFKR